jgi:hypothetical protein
MKFATWIRFISFVSFVCLCSGCYIKNSRICGPQTSMSFCNPEVDEYLLHPPQVGDQWNKDGVTFDQRRSDWVECGGRSDGDYTKDNQDKEKFRRIQRCMRDEKGYHYTGHCYDNEISRSLPACGAP